MTGLKKVLWVDDDAENVEEHIDLALTEFDIDLVHFLSWDEAEDTFRRDFDLWYGIILDAKCKYRRDETDYDPLSFLSPTINRINSICAKNGRCIPWFILSGGQADGIQGIGQILKNTERDWVAPDEPVYYSKSFGIAPVLEKILSLVPDSLSIQITNALYPEVFAAISHSGLKSDVRGWMIELLRPIHDTKISTAEYNNCFKYGRKVVEAIHYGLLKAGLLPKVLERDNHTPIMSWCSVALQGEDCEVDKLNLTKCPAVEAKAIREAIKSCPAYGAMPKIMVSNMKTIIHASGSDVHAGDKSKDGKRPYSVPEYQDSIFATSYLIRSFALQLCDMILWYDRYISQTRN